jgi:hypothetical protein
VSEDGFSGLCWYPDSEQGALIGEFLLFLVPVVLLGFLCRIRNYWLGVAAGVVITLIFGFGKAFAVQAGLTSWGRKEYFFSFTSCFILLYGIFDTVADFGLLFDVYVKEVDAFEIH